ncbi:MAG: hypothetical protein IJO55_12430 [Lachnospiraceae bacterium]|nr:hypothetical protein [Lachnospiraceae bacterium]
MINKTITQETINCPRCYDSMGIDSAKIGVCDKCAEKELKAIPKRIVKSFVISILLVTAVLLLCQYCRTHAYVSADPKEQDNIFLPYLFGTMRFRKAAFMNMIYPTKLGGAIFLLICFFAPFSSFIQIPYNTYRHTAEAKLFSGGLIFRDLTGTNATKMDDAGIFIVNVLLSLLSGPFMFVYRFWRWRKLKREILNRSTIKHRSK